MLVVQGRAPFHVLAVKSSDGRFRCTPPVEAAIFHRLPVTFLAPDAPAGDGRVAAKLRIETDLAGASAVELARSVQVLPAKEPTAVGRTLYLMSGVSSLSRRGPRSRRRAGPGGAGWHVFLTTAGHGRPNARRRRGVLREFGLVGPAATADNESEQASAKKSRGNQSHQPAPPMLVREEVRLQSLFVNGHAIGHAAQVIAVNRIGVNLHGDLMNRAVGQAELNDARMVAAELIPAGVAG